MGRLTYFMTQWRAYLRYMGLLVWPWNFNADNLSFGFSSSILETPVLAALFANLALAVGRMVITQALSSRTLRVSVVLYRRFPGSSVVPSPSR